MGIPIIISSYLKPLSSSMPFFMCKNTAPTTDVSAVNYFLEDHCTKALFSTIKKPLLVLKNVLSST